MKKFLVIITAMSALLSLTACGENNSQPSSKPESSVVSTPESTPASTPASDPESTPSSEPESTPASAPESTPSSEPESTTTSEPESTTTSEPESTTTSEPESTTTSDPESTTTSDPESATTSELESTPTSETENSVTNETESSVTSEPESVPAANAVLPLKEYPVGSYFTNDGKPCTDHGDCNWDKPCNCVNFDNSIQSVGFAKYAYYKVFGKHVSIADKTEVNAKVDEQTARDTLKGLPCGTYVAVTTGNDMFHAMAVVSADDSGITVYQANYGGGCVVSAPTYSWKQFAQLFPHIEYYVK